MCAKENILIFDRITRRRCDLLKFATGSNGAGESLVDYTVPLRRIFYEILDIVLAGIELRFTSQALDILAACDLVINQRNFTNNKFTERCNITIPEYQSNFFKHYCSNRLEEGAQLLDILNICKKTDLPEVHEFLLSLAVCPISSVSVERFFSTVNRVMIPSRKSMTSKRLNDLCLLSFEHDLTLN